MDDRAPRDGIFGSFGESLEGDAIEGRIPYWFENHPSYRLLEVGVSHDGYWQNVRFKDGVGNEWLVKRDAIGNEEWRLWSDDDKQWHEATFEGPLGRISQGGHEEPPPFEGYVPLPPDQPIGEVLGGPPKTFNPPGEDLSDKKLSDFQPKTYVPPGDVQPDPQNGPFIKHLGRARPETDQSTPPPPSSGAGGSEAEQTQDPPPAPEERANDGSGSTTAAGGVASDGGTAIADASGLSVASDGGTAIADASGGDENIAFPDQRTPDAPAPDPPAPTDTTGEYGDGPDLDGNGVPDEIGINPDNRQPGYPGGETDGATIPDPAGQANGNSIGVGDIYAGGNSGSSSAVGDTAAGATVDPIPPASVDWGGVAVPDPTVVPQSDAATSAEALPEGYGGGSGLDANWVPEETGIDPYALQEPAYEDPSTSGDGAWDPYGGSSFEPYVPPEEAPLEEAPAVPEGEDPDAPGSF